MLAALQIRPEEAGRTALLFLYLFLASVVFTTGRTARDALFLSALPDPTRWLPYMFVGYGLASALIAPFYSSLNERFRRDRFNSTFALGLAASYALSWTLIFLRWRPIYPILYIWVEVTNNLLIVQFWTLANDLHDPREAKRLFGVIGSSRMIGIVVCGLAVGAVVGRIGTPALLLINTGLLVLISGLVLRIGRRYLPSGQVARAISPHPEKSGPPVPLWRSTYVLLIMAMIVFTFIAATAGDYQFKIIAREKFSGEKLAAFFALFYSLVGAAAFFFHFFVSSRLLAKFGVIFGLLVMPALMGGSSIWLLLSGGSLLAAVALKLSDNAFQFTINDASLQLLYYPFPGELKARLKAMLEGAIKPLSYGAGGVILIFLSGRLGPVRLAWVVIPIVGLWIGVLFVLRGYYVKALINSLISRRLEPGGVEITTTPEVIQELSRACRSENESVFEFAITELIRLSAEEARWVLEDLLERPFRRAAALRRLADLGTSPEWARPYLTDSDPAVRNAAIWALAAALQENAVEEVAPFLKSDAAEEADTACAALICFAELEGVLAAGEHLRKLLEGDESCRARAARILGRAGVREFFRPIKRLLADASPAVRKEAVRAAGELKNRRLLDDLIRAVGEPALRGLTLEALEKFGDRALEKLAAALADESLPLAVRERLPRLIRKINRPEAVTALWAQAHHPNERLRIPILHHGERLQEKWSLDIDRGRVYELLKNEGLTAGRWLLRWKNLRPLGDDPLLHEALEQALYWCGRRIFSLLRFLYGPDAIGRIRYNLESGHTGRRANALETLDNLLPREERLWIVPLLDDSDRNAAVSALLNCFPQAKESAENSLAILSGPEYPYLSALLFRARLRKGEIPSSDEIARRSEEAGPLLLEELFLASRRFGYNTEGILRQAREKNYASVTALAEKRTSREDGRMLTTLERVLFLKQVPLFARVPGEDLARLAQEATVETFSAGENIFHQGDPGDSMYLIVSGEVSVHLEQTELTHLKEEDFFGEMAMLDQEPRSATVTALSPLTLLKITREDFLEIMADRPEIARAVFEVISKRLRQADAEIKKLACREPLQ